MCYLYKLIGAILVGIFVCVGSAAKTVALIDNSIAIQRAKDANLFFNIAVYFHYWWSIFAFHHVVAVIRSIKNIK